MSTNVDIKALLQAGAHFGHKTSRWHPAMAQYIHSKRGGSHIIDLVKTVEKLEEALSFLTQTAASGKQVLFVGIKRQAYDITKKLALDTDMPYVVERWAGGMLTNRNTIGGRIKHLKDLEAKMESGELGNKYNKLEVQRFQEEIESMNVLYGGIKDMQPKVGAVFIFDPTHDKNAVLEARKLGVPIVAITDTNADPTLITYPIPCNDDAIKTLQLIADYVKVAIDTGKVKASKVSEKEVSMDKAAKPVDKTEAAEAK
ncbi:30S ribosomal protein S2 [Candidatus Saccharibacteria bacterium]|nr:30S ribosomal protein S2 [Candidatus Saccharibacteria bacterium]